MRALIACLISSTLLIAATVSFADEAIKPAPMTQAERSEFGQIMLNEMRGAFAEVAKEKAKRPDLNFEQEMKLFNTKLKERGNPPGFLALAKKLSADVLFDSPKGKKTEEARSKAYIKLKAECDQARVELEKNAKLQPISAFKVAKLGLMTQVLESRFLADNQLAAEAAHHKLAIAYLSKLRVEAGLSPTDRLATVEEMHDNPHGKQADDTTSVKIVIGPPKSEPAVPPAAPALVGAASNLGKKLAQ